MYGDLIIEKCHVVKVIETVKIVKMLKLPDQNYFNIINKAPITPKTGYFELKRINLKIL